MGICQSTKEKDPKKPKLVTDEELFSLIIQAEIKPERLEEFKVWIKHNATESRKEETCVRFDVMQNATNEHVFHDMKFT